MFDRRAFLATASATVLAGPLAARAGEPLTLWGPPAAPSITLAHAAASGLLEDVGRQVVFKVWKTPDEMRAGLSSGRMGAVVVPTYVAANLYNRGLGLKLLNVLTTGLLYVVAESGGLNDVAGLKGRKLAVPFRNDMPDFILRHLLDRAGLKAGDLAIDYSGTPPEAAQLLLAGRVDAALLSEPASTAVIARGAMAGRKLARVIDCQKAWHAAGGRASIPQAGLVITDKLAAELGKSGVGALQHGLETAVRQVLADPDAAAAVSSAALDMPAPLVARSIPFSNLVVQPAEAAKADLAAFFGILAAADPRILGGKLPDERFYAS